ncbi:MAG: tRNA (N(6)-L-threonylcarbamoyladenosine(37)-C(2))-methylthiotransferase [Thermoproteota archaeon]
MNLSKTLLSNRKFFVLNYGCAANKAYSEALREKLLSSGVLEAENIENADVVIINSCTVKGATESKIIAEIKKLKDRGKEVVITGCMAVAQPGLVSYFVGKSNIMSLEELTERKNLPTLPKRPSSQYTHIVPISRGCLGHCTYCITRLAVGRLRSYPKEEIIESVISGLKRGAKEIFLTAQDLAIYGQDTGENKLIELLEAIDKIPFNFVVRLGMMTPNGFESIAEQLIDLVKNSDKFYKFLHIPLESGDDRILKLMGREYDSSTFRKLVNFSKTQISNLNFTTDVIVGFPTEDEEAFDNTKGLIYELKPFKVNVSKFTPRPHTLAAYFPKIKSEVVNERTRELSKIVRKLSKENKEALVKSKIKAIPLRKLNEKMYFGRSINYVNLIINSTKEIELGTIKEITVKELRGGLLLGSL